MKEKKIPWKKLVDSGFMKTFDELVIGQNSFEKWPTWNCWWRLGYEWWGKFILLCHHGTIHPWTWMAKTQSELQAKVSHFYYYYTMYFQPFTCSFHWIGQILMILNVLCCIFKFHNFGIHYFPHFYRYVITSEIKKTIAKLKLSHF